MHNNRKKEKKRKVPFYTNSTFERARTHAHIQTCLCTSTRHKPKPMHKVNNMNFMSINKSSAKSIYLSIPSNEYTHTYPRLSAGVSIVPSLWSCK